MSISHLGIPSSTVETIIYRQHLKLLDSERGQEDQHEATTCPMFTMPVLKHVQRSFTDKSQGPFPQYGLFAGLSDGLSVEKNRPTSVVANDSDCRVFFNVAAPSSIFICGSQGSGKSHSLSCLLENCLLSSYVGKLPNPLTGLVFHYDTFISDHGGSPCEAAFLSSNPEVKVRVLCSPTNIRTIQRAYHALDVQIEPLRIQQSDLNTKRMLDLMAVSRDDGPMPLYMHTVNRILREMRIEQQNTGATFEYSRFKELIMASDLTPAQLGPLNQRLDTLESFMPDGQTSHGKSAVRNRKVKSLEQVGNDWASQPGCLTIVDLSCPCVTPEGACSLFNICLSIFLDQSTTVGRVIALDEAHKYMNTSVEALTLTNSLLSTVRLQRHLGTRVIVSTQEPTVSPALLDLCSVTIVHRFTSPEWLRSLKGHLAGVASDLLTDGASDIGKDRAVRGNVNVATNVFSEVVRLRVGEALMFSPSAVVGLDLNGDGHVGLKRLGAGYLKIRVRKRLTTDGGKSVMAT